MSRVALVSSEPLRPAMAGIGIRYLELARRLPRHGLDTVVISPAEPAETAALGLPAAGLRRFEPGRLGDLLAGCDVVVAQGQLANDALLAAGDRPVVVDLYDPWLVENLAYLDTLGLDPYRNDHRSWLLQLGRGDFFLCSGEEQRLYYLGLLTALGRVNPHRVREDPDLEGLIAAVPFGVPEELPPPRPLLGPRRDGERRLLFGGLYDWYDPWTLLEALDGLEPPGWRLYLIRNPNPEATPQRLVGEVEARCRERGWWGERVELLDWVPAERRWDLLREVDTLVAPHRPSLETRLSFRTRFLDALAVGCPVVLSAGGPLSSLVEARRAGWVVAPGDVTGLRAALAEVLAGGPEVEARTARGREAAGERTWDRVLEPLVAFCRAPARDPHKEGFAVRLGTAAPGDPLGFRLRRWWRRLRGRR